MKASEIVFQQGMNGPTVHIERSFDHSVTVVADFVESDVQQNYKGTAFLISQIKKVQASELLNFVNTGNRYKLTVESTRSLIEDLYGESRESSSVVVDTSELLLVLEKWFAIIRSYL